MYYQILEGTGTIIKLNTVSRNPEYYDTLTRDHRFVIHAKYPQIYLQRRNDSWQFQPSVLIELQTLHEQLFKFGNNLFLQDMADETLLGKRVMGLELWQWLGILTVLIISLLIRTVFSLIFEKLLMKFLDRLDKTHIGEKYIVPVAKPTAMMVVFLFITLIYPPLQLPQMVSYYLLIILKGFIPLYGMIILYRLVNILEIYMIKLVKNSESTLDDQLVPLIKKVIKVVIVLLGGLMIMDSLHIPILPLLTGLSIGGLAFALAAQDTIKNFFGSIMIFIDKPFQIGDWITTSDFDGTVEEVGFRSTRVRTFRNSVVYVPNGRLADTIVDNNGLRQLRRFKTDIAIAYSTPPDRVEVFVSGLKRLVLEHPMTSNDKLEIHLNEMGVSSLNILFYIFFEAPTWSDELRYRQEIILAILKLGRHLNVSFAFPTQTVHVENLPGQESLSPNYTWTKEELNLKLNQFFDERA